ncbi:MAG: MBL fold metallo-hydrolase [Oligoflexales bacterium]
MKPTLIFTALLAANLGNAQDFSKVQVQTTKVAGNVHMLVGAGGNIGVSVGNDGVLIVDDQFKELAPKIRAAIAKLTPGPIKFVINTHWHGDHTGGNSALGDKAIIVAHENVRKRMSVEQFSKFFNKTIPASPKAALPIITFDGNITIYFNDEPIRIVHLPSGHTDTDSMVIFEKSKVAHLGDEYFSEGWPFIDLESGGTVRGYISNLETVIKTLDGGYKVIPGHGPKAGTVEDVKTFHQVLSDSSKFVLEKKKAGKTLDAIKKEGLPEQWSKWGKGFIDNDRWIETVFNG